MPTKRETPPGPIAVPPRRFPRGNPVRALYEALGCSREWLARELGMSVSNLEKHMIELSPEAIQACIRIADQYGLWANANQFRRMAGENPPEIDWESVTPEEQAVLAAVLRILREPRKAEGAGSFLRPNFAQFVLEMENPRWSQAAPEPKTGPATKEHRFTPPTRKR